MYTPLVEFGVTVRAGRDSDGVYNVRFGLFASFPWQDALSTVMSVVRHVVEAQREMQSQAGVDARH